MQLQHSDQIEAPAEVVYHLVRDKLPELAKYLPSVASIEQASREETPDGTLKIVNNWYASVDLPALVRKFLSDSLLSWKDTAFWSDDSMSVEYELQSFVVNDLFEAKGKNIFSENGDNKTRLTVTCEVNIYPEKIPGVPKLLMNKVKPLIEKIIEKMLQPNLTSLGEGLKAYLKENPV